MNKTEGGHTKRRSGGGPTEDRTRRLFVSFSGGETSAYMTRWLQLNRWLDYDEVQIVFANTGQENEDTLRFVQRCADAFGWDVTWVEAVVHHQFGKGTTHRVVDYDRADRSGQTFEEVIKKYGIPNQAYPHCNRELKLAPMKSYMRSIGWHDYDTAIGIRVDEIDRMVINAKEKKIIYPLIRHHPITKPEINAWWSRQPFRLQLAGFEGNCKWCWKKSMRKLLTLASRRPEWFEFPDRMEQEYGLSGSNRDGTPRVFFRQHMSTGGILTQALIGGFDDADDDSRKYPDTVGGVNLDAAGSCSESCDIYSDHDLADLDASLPGGSDWDEWRAYVLS